VLREASI